MADHDEPPLSALAALYAPLLATLVDQRDRGRVRMQKLEDVQREAAMWAHRRAAKHHRDRCCYRLGAAFEPEGGLALDDVFVSGVDLLGAHGLVLLAAEALRAPEGTSVSELMMRLSKTAAGKTVRAWGVWSRFTWLRNLYHDEVEAFENSPAGRDPKRSWRKEPATANQTYLTMELARALQVAVPEHANRGAAHDWLLAQGGNPRFQVHPDLPQLPSPADLKR